jgi:hypothetical protein
MPARIAPILRRTRRRATSAEAGLVAFKQTY